MDRALLEAALDVLNKSGCSARILPLSRWGGREHEFRRCKGALTRFFLLILREFVVTLLI
jgi:hypothetical protein